VSEQEFEQGTYEFISGDDWEETDRNLMEVIGFLAAMSGRLPHEVFDDPNWPKHILFNIKVSNIFWKTLLDTIKLRG
jgi:hypothetical protein